MASPERKTIQGERSEEVFHTAKMTEVFPIADVINSIMLIAQMKRLKMWWNVLMLKYSEIEASILEFCYGTVIVHADLRIGI